MLTPTEATTGRAPAASQRPVPAPHSSTPPRGASLNEASTRVHAIHPSGLPLACGRPDGSGQPLGFSPGLRTPPARSWTTHAEVGTGHRARTWNYMLNSSSSISNPVVHSLCATSGRTSPIQSSGPVTCRPSKRSSAFSTVLAPSEPVDAPPECPSRHGGGSGPGGGGAGKTCQTDMGPTSVPLRRPSASERSTV